MMKNVITAGLLGCLVLVVWTFVVNGLLGFRSRLDMNPIAAEREVYELLKESIVVPGRYICNPEVSAEGSFPGDEPVYSVLYSGMGHDSAGALIPVGLVLYILAPILGAALLSQASDKVLASYPRKVLFFTMIGMLLAVYGDLSNFGIGGYPAHAAFMLAVNSIVVWTLVGMVVAWRMRPDRKAFLR